MGTRVDVGEKAGPNCVSGDAAERLLADVLPALQEGAVDLDFGGVRILASPFLNALIGGVIAAFDERTWRDRLHVLGADERKMLLIRRVIENSLEHRSAQDEEREEGVVARILAH